MRMQGCLRMDSVPGMEGCLGMGSVPRNTAPAMALPVSGQCRTATRSHSRQEPCDPGRGSVAPPGQEAAQFPKQ